MPASDPPFPDDFPDLTLPERSDKPHAEPTPSAWPTRSRWTVGDRVLAPWEPDFLYAGRVAQIQGNNVLIEFDDGDAGRVRLDQLRPLAVELGQKVLCRRQMGPQFFPAEIREVRGEEVRVAFFADGEDEEWTRVAALRIPCQVTGPGAEPTRAGAPRLSFEGLAPGNRVWAPWDSGTLYAGTIDEVQGDEAHVHFDDGDAGWVRREQLLPLEIPVGLRVLARWKMGNHLYPGVVSKSEGERVFINYDDGDREWTTPAALLIPCDPFGPPARPTKVVRRGNHGISGWVIAIGLGILLGLLRAGCRAGP